MSRYLLAWLGLTALAPVLLHWWTRTRPRILRFAAFRLLPRREPDLPRKRSFDELPLMWLRVAALVLLGLAAAGPGCLREGDPLAGLGALPRPTALIDLSASMGVGQPGRRPIDAAAERLRSIFATGVAAHGGVYGCRTDGAVVLLRADELAQGSLLAILERELTAGGRDWGACLDVVDGEADLLVLSDEPPPADAGAWPGASVRWIGVGRNAPGGNAAIGPLVVEADRETVRISGSVVGDRPVAAVRIEWETPARPPVEVTLDDGQFAFELLAPHEPGRLRVRLIGDDDFEGDDAVPIWIPRAELPRVSIGGAWPPLAEHRLLALLFSAGERLRLGGSEEHAGSERRIRIVWRPEALPAAAQAELRSDVEAGATAVLFPQRAVGALDGLLPGWVHDPQPTARWSIVATPQLAARWPALRDLPWAVGEVRRLRPLAEPLPSTEVMLEGDGGLPLLVRHPLGAGEVYTWLADPDAEWTNLPTTSLWAPLWLAMFEILETRAAAAEIAYAPIGERPALRRLAPLWDGGGPGRWIGWWTARDGDGKPRLISTRFDPAEAVAGRAEGLTVLRDGPRGGATPPVPVDLTEAALAALVVIWVLQILWAARRSLRLRGTTVALTIAFVWPGLARAAESAMWLAVPAESAPSAGQLAGLTDLLRQVERRTSLRFDPSPQLFAWAVSDPPAPFVWWAGCRPPDLARQPRLAARVATFLRARGSLAVEACGGASEVERLRKVLQSDLAALGFAAPIRPLDGGHVVLRTFYLLEGWLDPDDVGTLYGQTAWGLDRLLVIPGLVRGLSRDAVGGYAIAMPPDAREQLIRQGVNLLMYAATWDYKNDSIHLPYILRRRQRQR